MSEYASEIDRAHDEANQETPSPAKEEKGKSKEEKGLASMKSFYFPGKKPFDDWNKHQLMTVLIRDGQVIRDENYISLSILKTFAEAVFLDREIPPKPAPLTMEEQNRRHTAALTIQNAYFTWMISSMHDQTSAPQVHMHDVIRAAMQQAHEVPAAAGAAAAAAGEERPQLQTSTSFRGDTAQLQQQHIHQMDDQEMNTGLEDLALENQLVEEEDEDEVGKSSILEEEFIPPSLEYASLYADYNHPRLGGLGGKLMPWLRTSTGEWRGKLGVGFVLCCVVLCCVVVALRCYCVVVYVTSMSCLVRCIFPLLCCSTLLCCADASNPSPHHVICPLYNVLIIVIVIVCQAGTACREGGASSATCSRRDRCLNWADTAPASLTTSNSSSGPFGSSCSSLSCGSRL
jgi:hypothetical protein